MYLSLIRFYVPYDLDQRPQSTPLLTSPSPPPPIVEPAAIKASLSSSSIGSGENDRNEYSMIEVNGVKLARVYLHPSSVNVSRTVYPGK